RRTGGLWAPRPSRAGARVAGVRRPKGREQEPPAWFPDQIARPIRREVVGGEPAQRPRRSGCCARRSDRTARWALGVCNLDHGERAATEAVPSRRYPIATLVPT